MAAGYIIDEQLRIVVTKAWAVFTGADLAAHASHLERDARFNPSFAQVVDFRSVERVEVGQADVAASARRGLFAKGSRRALVAHSDVLFGLSRMFEILHEATGAEAAVFRDLNAGIGWLGLSEHREAIDQHLAAITALPPVAGA